MSSSSLPFYSTRVREALAEIVAHHEGRDVPPGPTGPGTDAVPAAAATAIRGRWGGGDRASSSSSDDDDDDRGSGSDDDDASSAASRDSLEPIREDDGGDAAVAAPRADPAAAASARRLRGGKASRGKKSREDRVRKMTGRAPSVLLPFTTTTGEADASSRREALEVPAALLPRDFDLRDRRATSATARALLSAWDRLFREADDDAHAARRPVLVLVVLLQSGRFAACAYSLHADGPPRLEAHRTSTRYTVRKGQGGSQSSNDQSKGKAKSVGAQLRREGERQLREDVRSTWREWRVAGIIERAAGVYVSCPKGMRREYLFGGGGGGDGDGGDDALVAKDDERLRSIPLDVGRPTMEAAAVALECLLSCCTRDMTEEELRTFAGGSAPGDDNDAETERTVKEEPPAEKEQKVEGEVTTAPEEPPLTSLHEAVLDGDLPRLLELLTILEDAEARDGPASPVEYDVDTTGGPNGETALHAASSSDHPDAAALIGALLLRGRCDPCVPDSRGRPAYYLAASDRNREAFRLARGTLGEDRWPWDDGARVGPALTESDVKAKKARAAEKKRKQRARQKERRAAERRAAEEAAAAREREEGRRKEEEDAKRVRDGLRPRTSAATNACDFCQKVAKGKRRSQMFRRLDYAYCSTECVRRHQRELMAAAATARLGG